MQNIISKPLSLSVLILLNSAFNREVQQCWHWDTISPVLFQLFSSIMPMGFQCTQMHSLSQSSLLWNYVQNPLSSLRFALDMRNTCNSSYYQSFHQTSVSLPTAYTLSSAQSAEKAKAEQIDSLQRYVYIHINCRFWYR